MTTTEKLTTAFDALEDWHLANFAYHLRKGTGIHCGETAMEGNCDGKM